MTLFFQKIEDCDYEILNRFRSGDTNPTTSPRGNNLL